MVDVSPSSSAHSDPLRRTARSTLPLILSVVVAVAAVATLAYAPAAQWLAAYNQSTIIDGHQESLSSADPQPHEQLARARAYNDALSAGAILAAGATTPEALADRDLPMLEYDSMLRSPSGVMSRVQIPAIGVDLPVYAGTEHDTLLRGAGHLEGTSLPVGGEGTHAVITAHRGLPNATMFSDLDAVVIGDLFTVTTFGEVLTYRVVDTQVVDPADTQTLRQEAGRDRVTLVTCTPLGINSHRILVTGERQTPTPPDSLAQAQAVAAGPGFPWWALGVLAALSAIGGYTWRSLRTPRMRAPSPEATDLSR